MNKQDIRRWNMYCDSSCSDIYKAYKNPSYSKVRSFNLIKEEMDHMNGYDIRITGKNDYYYSCAYKYDVNGKTKLRYHTANYYYDIDVEEAKNASKENGGK